MLPAGPCDDRKMGVGIGDLKTDVLIACVCQCIVCPCKDVHPRCALARCWPAGRRRFSSRGGKRSSAFASLRKVRAGLEVRVKMEDGKEGGRRMGGREESHQSPCGWGAGPGERSPCKDLELLSFLPAHETQNNTCLSETRSERCSGGGRSVSSCPTTRRARVGISCKFDK